MRHVHAALLLLSTLVACAPDTSILGRSDASAEALEDAPASDLATIDASDPGDATSSDADDARASDLGLADATDARADVTADLTPADATRSDARSDAPADAPLTDRPDAADAASDAPVALVIAPAMSTLTVTSTSAHPAARFTATGRTRDGRAVPVTAIWTTSLPSIATAASDGTVTATGVAGGDLTVTARAGTLAASAALRVVVDVTVSTAGAPPDTAGLFTGAPTADAMRTPAWIYPANETVFPQNLNRVLFQWRPSGSNRFRVTFESDRTRVVVLTDGAHATCASAGAGLSCFEPELAVWRYLAASNPHGSVRVTVDGATSTAPGRYYRSATLSIAFSRAPVPGAIYYWSTTARGVRRGNLEEAAPRNFLTPTEASGNCVACHTLSRRGNRLAADVGGNVMWVVEVSATTPPPRLITRAAGRDIPMFWSTFSPDESRVVAAARGVMTLRNGVDGAQINTVTLARNTFGTQPDWAPDGTLMAFTSSATNKDRGVAGGRVAVVDVAPGDTWGTPRNLYGTGVTTDTNQFPSFSWDSAWIAFAHSARDGQNDVTSDIWLVSRAGTSARALTRANTVIGNGVITTPTVQDNMPTWAPTGSPDDYAWVAFSSTRDYGAVLTGTSRLGRHEQIWVAAVDLTRAATEDPSYPAFRLPCQDLDEDTHRPFWAIDRVRTACAASGAACAVDGDCCAPLTCNGGVCRSACAPLAGTCSTSADCCAPYVCLGGACRAPCAPSEGACSTATDCCAPGSCVSGSCAAPPCRVAGAACATSADCCAGTTCAAGVCTPPPCRGVGGACATAADCCAPLACASGSCQVACRAAGSACAADTDCCAPNTCRGGVCAPACRATSAACTTDTDCCGPNTCRGGVCSSVCRAAGATCATSADCCAPTTCTGGLCRAPCAMSGSTCSTDTDCCSGQVCASGMCRPPCAPTASTCATNADCCSGTCARGACAPPPCRLTGGSCAVDADCCAGVCVSGGCAPG